MKKLCYLFMVIMLASGCVQTPPKDDAEIDETADTSKGKEVTIKAFNNKFVCSDRSKNSEIFADRAEAKEWETFFVESINDSTIHLKTTNDNYVCADHSKNSILIANRKGANEWETFIKVKQSNGKYALKASNKKFVSVISDNGYRLVANKDLVGENEIFEFIEKKK